MVRPRLQHPPMLPPDGTVLEELISTMQSEYGTPSTPQEYRLIIKIAGGTSESNGTRTPEEAAPTVDGEATAVTADDVRRPKRRRRGRRRQGGQTEPFPEAVTTEDDDVDETIVVEGPEDALAEPEPPQADAPQ